LGREKIMEPNWKVSLVSQYHPSIHPSLAHGALIVHSELGHDKLHMNQTERQTDRGLYSKCTGFFFFQSARSKTCEPIICKAFYKRFVCHTGMPQKKHRVRKSEREWEKREKREEKTSFTLTQERWVGTNLPAKKHMTGKTMHEVLKKLWMDNILGSTSQVIHCT
jgi:hypothetical protein